MSRHRKAALVASAATSLCGSLWLAPPAVAGEVASRNGQYVLTLSANAKAGTSMAASEPEYAHRAPGTSPQWAWRPA